MLCHCSQFSFVHDEGIRFLGAMPYPRTTTFDPCRSRPRRPSNQRQGLGSSPTAIEDRRSFAKTHLWMQLSFLPVAFQMPAPADQRAEQERRQRANAEPDSQTKHDPRQDIAGPSNYVQSATAQRIVTALLRRTTVAVDGGVTKPRSSVNSALVPPLFRTTLPKWCSLFASPLSADVPGHVARSHKPDECIQSKPRPRRAGRRRYG